MSLTQPEIPHTNEVFVGSAWRTPSTDGVSEVSSPHSGQTVGAVPEVTAADADVAVSMARESFDSWSKLTPSERTTYVSAWRDALTARAETLTATVSLETGMPLSLSTGMTEAGLLLVNDALDLIEKVAFTEERQTATGLVEVRREAVGPTLVIGTYNGAVSGLGMSVAPALLMGNPVILKLPLENRLVGQIMGEAAAEAGFPEGVLSIFASDAPVSAHLVADPGIASVSFTGGTKIGAEVAASAATHLARVSLELGGKTAAIVADDVDIDTILPTLVGGACANQGQMCIASSRILVSRERHDELVDKLVSAFESLKIGDPMDPETEYGPVAADRVLERAQGFIERAVADGATLATGGTGVEGLEDGHYLRPALLTGVHNGMEIAQEEVFGPVFSVIAYEGIDEAVQIANDSKFGLYGTIYTNDEDLAQDVASRVRVGQFGMNGTFPSLAAPYGGIKQSGYGRVGGIEGMLEHSSLKVIV